MLGLMIEPLVWAATVAVLIVEFDAAAKPCVLGMLTVQQWLLIKVLWLRLRRCAPCAFYSLPFLQLARANPGPKRCCLSKWC